MAMPAFIYLLKSNRPGLMDDMSPQEELVLEEHFEYLQREPGEGKPVLAGLCLDGELGIVVFRARTREETLEFTKDDPAVRDELMTADFHPFRNSLMDKG